MTTPLDSSVANDNGVPIDLQPSQGGRPDEASTKFLIVTGGTLSGLGKGTTISSIGVVLKSLGFRVTSIKIDPYLNIDAGTMSPYEHGEVYVLDDGGEVDLDLGNYERFLGVTLCKDHNITTGKIYERVIKFERQGRYLGKTVQVVPHITNAIQVWIQAVSQRSVDESGMPPDICLVELGGTVGDIESQMYLEALNQMSHNVGYADFCLCHVSFVPVMGVVGEQKTKPTQHSVKELRGMALRPDFIFCRSEQPVSEEAKKKIGMFSQVPPANVISVHDVSNIYHVPAMIDEQEFGVRLCKRLNLKPRIAPEASVPPPMTPSKGKVVSAVACESDGYFDGDFEETNPPVVLSKVFNILARRVDTAQKLVRIGLVGKYTGLMDSYLSVLKALRHAAMEAYLRIEIDFIESTHLEQEESDPKAYKEAWKILADVDGILCPGGFGDRGIIGKSLSARFCRQNKKPYLGICLGMQTAVIDMCRELGYADSNSEEFNAQAEHKVVIFMPEINPDQMGGTMRLGSRRTIIQDPNCLAAKLYGSLEVLERHRHRFEVNTEYVEAMEKAGMRFVGKDEDGTRMEIAELSDHPFFMATQYHPEFTSRPLRPNPCFLGFVLASAKMLDKRLAANGGKLKAGCNFYRGSASAATATSTAPSSEEPTVASSSSTAVVT